MTVDDTSPRRARSEWMDDELEAVAELARAFFERDVLPLRDKFAKQGHPDRDRYEIAGNHGLLCMSIPEAYGGGGGTIAHDAVLFTEQVRAGDHSMHLGVHSTIVPHYLLAYATEEQKQTWLPQLAAGCRIGAIAMTEPGAGTDLQNIRTRAVRDGEDYLITGAKTFISNGLNCDLLIVAAKTGPGEGARGISLFVLEVNEPLEGFARGRIIEKVGQKGQDTLELFFDNVPVPAANLLGGVEGKGFAQLMNQLAFERLICGISAVAAMEKAVDLTVEYTKSRELFGKPLFEQQNTRFELAECATVTRVARTFLDGAISAHLRGELDPTTAAMVKFWTTDRQCEVIDRCLQLHGGYGYTLEYPIGQMFADARVQRIYAGANEVMKELVARSL